MNHLQYPVEYHDYFSNADDRLIGRPFGFGRPYGFRPGFGRPFGFGAPFLGGFIGGLALGSLAQPYAYPYYPVYPYGGYYW
ncbi:hypothetical protein [Lederbergia galactosidilytica]|uniref:Spore coat protein n=1 Tax=Lederbergia galactosidilytica TaxID=217031 RepID=A0A0Q9Y9A6_9BACI|nr:hypothetical protein [Lederbergia galactosidilytica]KRG14242.1 hypothetical protein ACA29_06400 [Lederbergia galactosidilytica]KRG15070.1 hypothetical protein ACA30_07770 [Virgibacillus soli]MBP1913319.1 hypothetical protein [Lederbergia galactosidilytica]OAK67963.1 hypothetical protein ABB05_18190 [Lederbergia galactosidilytica]